MKDLVDIQSRALNFGSQGYFEIFRYCQSKKKLSKFYSKHSKLWYFNRVKIISLLETHVSEARVATQLGFPKSLQDKTNRIY
jgi:hypothetical protein